MLLLLHACFATAAPPLAAPSIQTLHAPGLSDPPDQHSQRRPIPENLAAGAASQTITVTATAYTSHRDQTIGDPHLAAWGDTIKPGMKCIAVSRDLIRMGLTRDTPVRIRGLPGTYVVKDKLHRRWTKRIDIYLGMDVQAARQWGKRKVVIEWPAAVAPKGSPARASLCLLYSRSVDRPPAYPFHQAIR